MDNVNNPVEMLTINLSIQLNLAIAAYEYGIKKTLFLGSSCIYPKFSKYNRGNRTFEWASSQQMNFMLFQK